MKNRRSFLKESTLATASLIFCGINAKGENNLISSNRMSNNTLTILHGINSSLLEKNKIKTHFNNLAQNNDRSIISIDQLNSQEQYCIVKTTFQTAGIIYSKHLSKSPNQLIKEINILATELKEIHNCTIVICELPYNDHHSFNKIENKIAYQTANLDLIISNTEKNSYEVYLNKLGQEVYISHNNIHSNDFKQIEFTFNHLNQKNNIELKNIVLNS